MFAGETAAKFKSAKREGRLLHGFADGLPRFRIDDRTSTLTPLALGYMASLRANPTTSLPLKAPLFRLLTHSRLYRNYPGLRLLDVSMEVPPVAGKYLIGPRKPRTGGSLTDAGIKVFAAPNMTAFGFHLILLHEVQHEIQNSEGFAKGTNAGHEFGKLVEERLSRHQLLTLNLSGPGLRAHTEFQELAMRSPKQLKALLNGEAPDLLPPSAAASHLFWRLRDCARACYRQNAGEIEARQVQHEFTLTGDLPATHITITNRPHFTRRLQSARWTMTMLDQ